MGLTFSGNTEKGVIRSPEDLEKIATSWFRTEGSGCGF
jgi:hypothetical protein